MVTFIDEILNGKLIPWNKNIFHGTFQRLRKKYFLKVKILEPQILNLNSKFFKVDVALF